MELVAFINMCFSTLQAGSLFICTFLSSSDLAVNHSRLTNVNRRCQTVFIQMNYIPCQMTQQCVLSHLIRFPETGPVVWMTADGEAKCLLSHESISGKHNKPKGHGNQPKVKSLAEVRCFHSLWDYKLHCRLGWKTSQRASLPPIFSARTQEPHNY